MHDKLEEDLQSIVDDNVKSKSSLEQDILAAAMDSVDNTSDDGRALSPKARLRPSTFSKASTTIYSDAGADITRMVSNYEKIREGLQEEKAILEKRIKACNTVIDSLMNAQTDIYNGQ